MLADIIIRLKRTIFLSVFDIDSLCASIHVYYVEHYEKAQYWFQWIYLVCMKLPHKQTVAEFLKTAWLFFNTNSLLQWRPTRHF